MNKSQKKELLMRREKIEKKKILYCANLIDSANNIEIIDIIQEYDKKLREMYKIDYPIYKQMDSENVDIQKFSENIDFNNGDSIILPYFNGTEYWIKIIIQNKMKFFQYMFENGYFTGFSIICSKKHILYHIEMGEQYYEIYINQIVYLDNMDITKVNKWKMEKELQKLLAIEFVKEYCHKNNLSLQKLKNQIFELSYDACGFLQPSDVVPEGLVNDRETMPKPTLIIKNVNGQLVIKSTEYTKIYLKNEII